MSWWSWADFYDTSLSPLNRKARAGTHRTLVDFTSDQRAVLRDLCIQARSKVLHCPRIRNSPLRIRGVEEAFENGYPHTHSDTIFLPCPKFFEMSSDAQLEVLIHEWIHVYQRMNPIPFHKYLFEVEKFEIVGLTSSHSDFASVRRNPDVNDLIYSNGSGEFSLPHLDKDARSLKDVRTAIYGPNRKRRSLIPSNPSTEHPFEKVAYNLSKSLISGTADDRITSRYF